MTGCFKGRKRPLTQEDVESLDHPGALTEELKAYILDGEIYIVTKCPRIARSQWFERVENLEISGDAEPILTIPLE